MPRPRKLDPIRMAVQDMGRILGQELGNTASSVVTTAERKPGKRGRPALSAAEAPCEVPGCGKKRAAWGLCANHYQKARRLQMKPGKLNLATLAKDGRASRWQK